MHPGLKKLFHCDNCHCFLLFGSVFATAPSFPSRTQPPSHHRPKAAGAKLFGPVFRGNGGHHSLGPGRASLKCHHLVWAPITGALKTLLQSHQTVLNIRNNKSSQWDKTVQSPESRVHPPSLCELRRTGSPKSRVQSPTVSLTPTLLRNLAYFAVNRLFSSLRTGLKLIDRKVNEVSRSFNPGPFGWIFSASLAFSARNTTPFCLTAATRKRFPLCTQPVHQSLGSDGRAREKVLNSGIRS